MNALNFVSPVHLHFPRSAVGEDISNKENLVVHFTRYGSNSKKKHASARQALPPLPLFVRVFVPCVNVMLRNVESELQLVR